MSDINQRLKNLSAEQRQQVMQELQKKVEVNRQRENLHAQYDVVILGGGLAGLTLARQLKQTRPQTNILVVEKRKHPVPEAAFKVGESSVEMGSHYLRTIIGFAHHLENKQLPKAGLRYFFPAGDNRDITQRTEMGATTVLPVSTHQIDRGLFENDLAIENQKIDITFWDDCKVQQILLDADEHVVNLIREGEKLTVGARWVVDASGRGSLLKRQLGLTKESTHNVNAVWFRIDETMNVADWSDDAQWQARVPRSARRLSTTHLMGPGYWVWLIPLPSGATSFGIVADPRLHPHQDMNRFDRALEWLKKYEPQCAQAVAEKSHLLQDFLALRHFAHGCKQVYSAERWCLTGEAGVFVDPFYSPGSDFIGLSNSFITELIIREMRGEDIQHRAVQYNSLLLDTFRSYIGTYEDQYLLMGNAQVMMVKVLWDFAIYWGVNALIFFHNKSTDLNFLLSIAKDLARFDNLNIQMQRFFQEWDQKDNRERLHLFVDYMKIDFISDLHHGLKAGLNDDDLRAKVLQNIDMLEEIVAEVMNRVAQLEPTSTNGNGQHQPLPTQSNAQNKNISPNIKAGLDKIWLDLLVPLTKESI